MSGVDLVTVLLLGFVGSTHCLAMCSAFVLCASQSSALASWLYQGGRGAAYMLLGAALALCGRGVRLHWEQSAGRPMLLVAGLLMMLLGLAQVGVVRLPETTGGWVGPTLARLLRVRSAVGVLGLGAFTAMLPCPLLYAALLRASVAGSPWQGGLVMAAFWVGTLPAMVGLSAVAPWMRRHGAVWWPRLAMVVSALLGALTFYHGMAGPSSACPGCH